jgi:hypothetical protein
MESDTEWIGEEIDVCFGLLADRIYFRISDEYTSSCLLLSLESSYWQQECGGSGYVLRLDVHNCNVDEYF